MVQFRLYSVSLLLSERHEWPAAPITACLRRGPRGCFCNEKLAVNAAKAAAWPTAQAGTSQRQDTGGESVVAPVVNCSLAPGVQWGGNGVPTPFSRFALK